MSNNNLAKIKILFSGGILLLITIIVIGGLVIKKQEAVVAEYFTQAAQYWRYNIDLYYETKRIQVANAIDFKENIENKPNVNNLLAQDVPVLVYHGIVKKADRFSMTQEVFKNQMFALKRAGYKTITIDDFKQFQLGIKTLPEKSFLLTFDDGRTDSNIGASPILKVLGFKAVMFVATDDSFDTIEKHNSYYLDKNNIQRMLNSGLWDIQSHSVQANSSEGLIYIDSINKGNFLSNKMWLANENRIENDDEYLKRINQEFINSKKILEDIKGGSVITFSYPFGDYGQQTKNYPSATKVISEKIKLYYDIAFEQVWPKDNNFTSNYPGMDMHHLHRIEPDTTWTGQKLVKFISTIHSKEIGYRDLFTENNGWKNDWGEVSFSDQSLSLKATAATNGAFSFLDGTYLWKNYFYNIDALWNSGTNVSLIARFQNENNYLSCNFQDGLVSIKQIKNGKTSIIREEKTSIVLPLPKVSFGILVNDSFIECFEGSRGVVFATIHDKNNINGGIAIQIWNSVPNNAELIVHELNTSTPAKQNDLKAFLPRYKIR